jgi:excisionase family DNA binding protein
MDELLTAKQVQELLKVDRTTIYRMLDDGRLTGIKVGHQWRFSSQEVHSMLSGARPIDNTPTEERSTGPMTVLPLHCIQPIQNVFAEVANIASVTTAPSGEPLTKMSNPCQFCSLILATESGRKACVNSWCQLSEQPETQPLFASCHAGLQYARARIEIDGELAALQIAGQFFASEQDRADALKNVTAVAKAHGIDIESLNKAALDIPILDERKRALLGIWLKSVAHTFEQIGAERAELINRLQRIAEMSTLKTD